MRRFRSFNHRNDVSPLTQGLRYRAACDYLIPCRFSTDPEIYDLGWLWMAWTFIICYSIVICDLAFSNFFLTYLLYGTAREVEFRIVIRRIFGIGETLHRWNVNDYLQNYDIVLVLHCISTDSKHCSIDICVKFCFAPICLELWSLGFRSLSTVKLINL